MEYKNYILFSKAKLNMLNHHFFIIIIFKIQKLKRNAYKENGVSLYAYIFAVTCFVFIKK